MTPQPKKKDYKEPDNIIPFALPPLAPEAKKSASGLSAIFNTTASGQAPAPANNNGFEQSFLKPPVEFVEMNRESTISLEVAKPADEIIAKIAEETLAPPSFFDGLIQGLKNAFHAAYDKVMEGHRRKLAFHDAMATIDHALFVRPGDAQTWLLRSDVVREIDALNGRHYYNQTSFDDMPAPLREGIDKARREIAFQTIIGPLQDKARAHIEGKTSYELPKRFTLSDRHMKQALKAVESMNDALGTPQGDIGAWVHREEVAEELAALHGMAIPHDVLASLPQNLAAEIDAKRRFVAFQRLTGGMKDEILALKAPEQATIQQRKDLH